VKKQEAKKLRAKEADERMEERSNRSPAQQIERLDTLLGKGVGAESERARLQEQVEKEAVHHEKKKKKKDV